MPEESINIFISNIYSTAIFTGVFVLLFLLLFFISRIFISRTKIKEKPAIMQNKGQRFVPYEINKDTGQAKTLFVAGLIFALALFFIFLIILSAYFANNFNSGAYLYLIFHTVFLILLITVYVIKSGIISRQ